VNISLFCKSVQVPPLLNRKKRKRQVCLWRQRAFLAGHKSRVSGLSFHFSASLSFLFLGSCNQFSFPTECTFRRQSAMGMGMRMGTEELGGNLIKKWTECDKIEFAFKSH